MMMMSMLFGVSGLLLLFIIMMMSMAVRHLG